jgi:hypothetical protein
LFFISLFLFPGGVGVIKGFYNSHGTQLRCFVLCRDANLRRLTEWHKTTIVLVCGYFVFEASFESGQFTE